MPHVGLKKKKLWYGAASKGAGLDQSVVGGFSRQDQLRNCETGAGASSGSCFSDQLQLTIQDKQKRIAHCAGSAIDDGGAGIAICSKKFI